MKTWHYKKDTCKVVIYDKESKPSIRAHLARDIYNCETKYDPDIEFCDWLNEQGKQGWELIQFECFKHTESPCAWKRWNEYICCFKRQGGECGLR